MSLVRRVLLVVLLVSGSIILNYAVATIAKEYLPELLWNANVGDRATRSFQMADREDNKSFYGLFFNFDSNFYYDIATNGYSKEAYYPGIGMRNWAFFPLYPALVGGISSFFNVTTSEGVFYVGAIVSTLFFVIFLTLLTYIADLLGYTAYEDHLLLLFLILAYPTSYFFTVFYTESLFAALAAFVFYFGIRRQYIFGALSVMLAGATKNSGVVLIVPLLVYLLIDSSLDISRKVTKGLACIAISICGALTFFAYLRVITGDFLTSMKIQAEWLGRGASSNFLPLRSLATYFDNFLNRPFLINNIETFGVVVLLFSLAILVYNIIYQKLNTQFLPLYVYSALYLALISSSGSNMSMTRFVMVLFPVYFYLLDLCTKNKLILYSVLITFVTFRALLMIIFILKVPSPGV